MGIVSVFGTVYCNIDDYNSWSSILFDILTPVLFILFSVVLIKNYSFNQNMQRKTKWFFPEKSEGPSDSEFKQFATVVEETNNRTVVPEIKESKRIQAEIKQSQNPHRFLNSVAKTVSVISDSSVPLLSDISVMPASIEVMPLPSVASIVTLSRMDIKENKDEKLPPIPEETEGFVGRDEKLPRTPAEVKRFIGRRINALSHVFAVRANAMNTEQELNQVVTQYHADLNRYFLGKKEQLTSETVPGVIREIIAKTVNAITELESIMSTRVLGATKNKIYSQYREELTMTRDVFKDILAATDASLTITPSIVPIARL